MDDKRTENRQANMPQEAPAPTPRDVVLNSRVRLARNFADIPFPTAMHGDDGARAQYLASEAVAHVPEGNGYALLRVHDMADARRRALVEQNLISRELLSSGEFAAVLLRRDERVGIMLNEEDHLRIHAILPGDRLEEAAALAFEVDDAIGREVRYAFDAELGFLTSCPMNTGTGMRASVLLHLPSLTRTKSIDPVSEELSKLGLKLKPLYREDNEAVGELYLLSNNVTLGRSEEDLIESIQVITSLIVDRERTARETLLLRSDLMLEDQLMRSLGTLRYARRLSESEWLRRWSDVRLAVQAGMIHMPLESLDALLDAAKPAHLEMVAGFALSPNERDERRATLIREALVH